MIVAGRPRRFGAAGFRICKEDFLNITVVGRHLEVTNDVKEYVESKVGKLDRFFERLGGVKITLSSEGQEMAVEITAGATKGVQIFAEAKGENLFAALDLAVDKAERQVTKHKEKMHGHREKRQS